MLYEEQVKAHKINNRLTCSLSLSFSSLWLGNVYRVVLLKPLQWNVPFIEMYIIYDASKHQCPGAGLNRPSSAVNIVFAILLAWFGGSLEGCLPSGSLASTNRSMKSFVVRSY